MLNELCNDSTNLALILEIFRQSFILLPQGYASIIQRHPGSIHPLGARRVPRTDNLQLHAKRHRNHGRPCLSPHSVSSPQHIRMVRGMEREDSQQQQLTSSRHDEDTEFTSSFLAATHAYRTQLKLCGLVIQFYTLISQEPFVILNEATWEHLLVTLLNATNYLVKMGQFESNSVEAASKRLSNMGNGAEDTTNSGAGTQHTEVYSTMEHLINPLLSCLFDCYLRSCISTSTAPNALSMPIFLSSSHNNGDSPPLSLKSEMESKIRSWLHRDVSAFHSSASSYSADSSSSTSNTVSGNGSGASKAVIEAWKSKLLGLTRGLVEVLANVTSDEQLARPRTHPGARRESSLNPIIHGHRVGSIAAIYTQAPSPSHTGRWKCIR